MDTDTEELIDRLRGSRSRPLLRLIDDAELDRPADVDPHASVVVEPYRWLLERIGDGVKLTQAGYLPPALVTEAMTTLGWERDWYGKHNREDHTIPILELRESAQRFGLLRKNRGHLLVTKIGRNLVDDPVALWWHLATRLPDGRTEPERHAGVLYLLSVAAGRPEDQSLLADGMSILGWAQRGSRQRLSPTAAFAAARDTWALFRRLDLLPRKARWDDLDQPPSPSGVLLARAALLGRGHSAAAPAPPRQPGEKAVELAITLRGIDPPIWRRLVVPAALTLSELHAVIQTAMGWQDYHLHMFEVYGVLYGDVEDFEGELGDEDSFTVGQAADAVREFSYEYDLGDSWQHDILVEQVVPSVGIGTPHLVGGARACPPEDCGGPWGYQHLLDVLADPSHEEHDQLREWLGRDWDAEAFELTATNANLELYDRHTRQRLRSE